MFIHDTNPLHISHQSRNLSRPGKTQPPPRLSHELFLRPRFSGVSFFQLEALGEFSIPGVLPRVFGYSGFVRVCGGWLAGRPSTPRKTPITHRAEGVPPGQSTPPPPPRGLLMTVTITKHGDGTLAGHSHPMFCSDEKAGGVEAFTIPRSTPCSFFRFF